MSIAISRFLRLQKKRYQDVRPLIRSGDLLLCSGSALFSKMIQKATKSVWSHIAFVLRLDSIDRVMVLESLEPQGVRTVPLSSYVHDYNGTGKGYPGRVLLARHRQIGSVATSKLKRMSQFAVDRFGYPYDKDEIIRIAARIGRGIFGFTPGEVKRDKEYICSEYAWECFNRVGIRFSYDRRGFIAPRDFAVDSNVQAIARLL